MMDREGRRASIHDVAKQAGVSAATVSKVLRGDLTVRPANQARVRQAIVSLDYRRDPFAADLRRATRRIAGLIVPELESEFFGRLAAALELLAEEAGLSLVIASSHGQAARERELIRRMHDWRVAGTILAPTESGEGEGAIEMLRLGMTGVLVDRVIGSPDFDVVTADNRAASGVVAEKFVAAGCAKALVFGPSARLQTIRMRIEGFERSAGAMRVTRLAVEPDRLDLAAALSAWLDAQTPDAIFALDQHATMRAMAELRRRGLRCPEDLLVIGFDDAAWMASTYPSISAVAQPVERIAQSAFHRLRARIAGVEEPPQRILEPCLFEERDSSKERAAVTARPLSGHREALHD